MPAREVVHAAEELDQIRPLLAHADRAGNAIHLDRVGRPRTHDTKADRLALSLDRAYTARQVSLSPRQPGQLLRIARAVLQPEVPLPSRLGGRDPGRVGHLHRAHAVHQHVGTDEQADHQVQSANLAVHVYDPQRNTK